MTLLNASGCLDASTAPDVARSLDAFVTKTITPEPREGNPPVRIAETGAGMLNSIGLANPGRKQFLAETLPSLRELGVPRAEGASPSEEGRDLDGRVPDDDQLHRGGMLPAAMDERHGLGPFGDGPEQLRRGRRVRPLPGPARVREAVGGDPTVLIRGAVSDAAVRSA